MKIIKGRVECGALERSFGPYRNPWFLVPKKSGKYMLINSAQRLNAVTIRDASLPPTVDEFSEEFAGFPLISLLDLFSGYDQCSLDPVSRDLTAFMTPFGLMRMATLPQGYTKGVQVFDRVIRKVLFSRTTRTRTDVFALGCIFADLVMTSVGVKLQAFRKARRSHNEDYIRCQQGLDYSFAGNLSNAQKFIEKGAGNINGRRGTVPVIMEMWANDQVNRPTLGAVMVKLNSIRMDIYPSYQFCL